MHSLYDLDDNGHNNQLFNWNSGGLIYEALKTRESAPPRITANM